MLKASDVSPRMFDNDLLDFFSRTPWLIVPALYVPLSLGVAGWAVRQGAGLLTTAVAFAFGVIVWTLTEYWLHRTAFHWVPNASWGEQFHFLVHGVHHKWHQDPYRLVMPPAVSLTLAVVFYGVFWGGAQLGALAGLSTGWHLGAYAGFVLGYCIYDCTHYMIHHWRPRGGRMKRLKTHHMDHHFHEPDLRFGVSTTIWDRVFGTAG
jgi:Sterol desaturase